MRAHGLRQGRRSDPDVGDSGSGSSSGEVHTHTPGDYTWDEDLHTKKCTVCGDTIEEADHVYDGSNTCTVCGYTIVPTEGLEYEQQTVTGIGTAGEEAKIVIPAYHDGRPVTAIESAFYECTFTEVHIPSTVESILYSFDECDSLTEVRIPDSVTTICAFGGNDVLKRVIFGENSRLLYLGKSSFAGNPELASVNLPDSLRYTDDDIFEDSKIFTDKSFWTDGLLYIGNHLISADVTLSGTQTVRAGTLSLANNAFWRCKDITEVVLPEGLLSINLFAFDECTALKRVVAPVSLEYFGDMAFGLFCDSLETIEYGGTMEQWKTLFGEKPLRQSSDYVVKCTNGTLDKNGNAVGDGGAMDSMTAGMWKKIFTNAAAAKNFTVDYKGTADKYEEENWKTVLWMYDGNKEFSDYEGVRNKSIDVEENGKYYHYSYDKEADSGWVREETEEWYGNPQYPLFLTYFADSFELFTDAGDGVYTCAKLDLMGHLTELLVGVPESVKNAYKVFEMTEISVKIAGGKIESIDFNMRIDAGEYGAERDVVKMKDFGTTVITVPTEYTEKNA